MTTLLIIAIYFFGLCLGMYLLGVYHTHKGESLSSKDMADNTIMVIFWPVIAFLCLAIAPFIAAFLLGNYFYDLGARTNKND